MYNVSLCKDHMELGMGRTSVKLDLNLDFQLHCQFITKNIVLKNTEILKYNLY